MAGTACVRICFRNVICPRSVVTLGLPLAFVSLIPEGRLLSGEGEHPGARCTLIRMQGGDHAILLCSLLLNWGMDAWVCYGTIMMLTPERHDGGMASNPVSRRSGRITGSDPDDLHEGRLVFWESLTGQQYNVLWTAPRIAAPVLLLRRCPPRPPPFREVFSLFRHDAFVLNIQRFALVSAKALENKTVFALWQLSST